MTDTPVPTSPTAVPSGVAALPSGAGMPLLGFGTWRLSGSEAVRATTEALAVGYRHLDTATLYGNEREVGKPPEGDGVAVWEEFVAARADGLVRDIGVSNHSIAQIEELERATGVRPAVNQVRWSPLLFDRGLLDAHRERGIVLEGYSALKGGTLEHPVVTGIAERLRRTPAQVLVRWHLEHGVVVIPKSASPERIRSNAAVDDIALTADDVAALDALGVRA